MNTKRGTLGANIVGGESMDKKPTEKAHKWGGVRRGAGRKASGDTPRHTRTIALNDAEEAILTAAAILNKKTLAEFMRENALAAARAVIRSIAGK